MLAAGAALLPAVLLLEAAAAAGLDAEVVALEAVFAGAAAPADFFIGDVDLAAAGLVAVAAAFGAIAPDCY